MQITLEDTVDAKSCAELLSNIGVDYTIAINGELYKLKEPVSSEGFVVQPFDEETGKGVGETKLIDMVDVKTLSIW